MRPGNQNNKRMRGRGRKGPNPLSRSYESNGPDVKIRGTALHIAEKYQQLARDAQASGDRIMSENYFQHAEHYLRIVAAAQAHLQPAAQNNRSDSDDAGQETATSGSGMNGNADRHDQAQASAGGDTVGEDSPQPYIEDMPLIDASGQVNGHASEAGSEKGEDAKPRRRTRGTRGRGVKSEAAETAAEANAAAEAVPGSSDDEEAPKPKPRRAPRTRKAKPADESADAEAVTAGE
ncbi:DUF4167 domain-containing protein [uncultured Roseibium sp.]|uniref:DUF4167 domain-containing protein n=1 Tax=uncultured Roseibium sp. TaxID=1936171 RepID=UPI003216ACEC